MWSLTFIVKEDSQVYRIAIKSRSPVVPPGFSPPKRPRPPEVVFVLVPLAKEEPNRLPPVVPAVVVAAGFVELGRFPNIPPPVAPVLIPNRLPPGAAALDVLVVAVFNPRAFDVAGPVAPSGGLLKPNVVAAAEGVMVDPVEASKSYNY